MLSASIVCTPTSCGHHLLPGAGQSASKPRLAAGCVHLRAVLPQNPAKGQRGHRAARHERGRVQQNKPRNLDRIVNDRVWSFEITDHTTGWIYVEYRFGGESAVNFLEVMINAMQERGSADVLHGVPKILFTDPGSALVSASLLNMCRAMGIRTIQHKAHNARATGSVEKARDIIERKFEGGLRFLRVDDIDELNRLARLWRMKFNRTAIHSRHSMSRTDAAENYRRAAGKAPTLEICRELAISAPEERTVTGKLRVPFRGKEYDVSDVPGVFVSDKVLVARNPWSDEEARVVIINDEGFETFHVIHAIQKDELWQYSTSAPVIGEEYRQLPETVTRANRDQVEQHTYGTANRKKPRQRRKTKPCRSVGASTLIWILSAMTTQPTCLSAVRLQTCAARVLSSVR